MLTKIANELFTLQNWDFEIFQDDAGEYSFHGATVCDYFGIKNPSVAIQRHVDEDWRFKAPVELGKGSNAWMIKEPGLYQLAMIAKTPMAKEFQRWVYGTVLKKLRANGGYIMPNATSEQLTALQKQLQLAQNQINTLERVNNSVRSELSWSESREEMHSERSTLSQRIIEIILESDVKIPDHANKLIALYNEMVA